MSSDESLVAVRLGTAEFGLPITRVREVLAPPPITRVPFAPAEVCGVTSVRGTVLPVLDLGLRLFGHAAQRPGLLVVVWGGEELGLVGVLVDGVSGLVEAPPETLEPPPEAEATLPPGLVLGVVAPEPGRLVTVLDLEPVLATGESPDKEP